MPNSKSSGTGTKPADLYDFTNVGDLPPEVARKVKRAGKDNAVLYAEIVNNAPRPLNISEVMAVAIRKFGSDAVPGAQSVRNYLNSAVAMGLITKPSRQTYGKGSRQG